MLSIGVFRTNTISSGVVHFWFIESYIIKGYTDTIKNIHIRNSRFTEEHNTYLLLFNVPTIHTFIIRT